MKVLAPALRLAAIFDLHALAVVGQDDEIIRPWPRALPAPERLQQTGSQRQKAEQFEEHAPKADSGVDLGALISPEEQPQSNDQQSGCWQKPISSRDEYGG
jgi:hypothetical protein